MRRSSTDGLPPGVGTERLARENDVFLYRQYILVLVEGSHLNLNLKPLKIWREMKLGTSFSHFFNSLRRGREHCVSTEQQ